MYWSDLNQATPTPTPSIHQRKDSDQNSESSDIAIPTLPLPDIPRPKAPNSTPRESNVLILGMSHQLKELKSLIKQRHLPITIQTIETPFLSNSELESLRYAIQKILPEPVPSLSSRGFRSLEHLCKNKVEVIKQLNDVGISHLSDLVGLNKNDILNMKLQDIVIQRRLINYCTPELLRKRTKDDNDTKKAYNLKSRTVKSPQMRISPKRKAKLASKRSRSAPNNNSNNTTYESKKLQKSKNKTSPMMNDTRKSRVKQYKLDVDRKLDMWEKKRQTMLQRINNSKTLQNDRSSNYNISKASKITSNKRSKSARARLQESKRAWRF